MEKRITQYGKYTNIVYNKETVFDHIGIKRSIYDLIFGGNIDTDIRWINRIILKKGCILDDIIKEIIDNYGNKENLIVCFPGELVVNTNSHIIDTDSYLETIKKEEDILENHGFIKVFLGKNISGNMASMMIYKNETAKTIMNSLKDKGIIHF